MTIGEPTLTLTASLSAIETCPADLTPRHVASFQANGFLAFADLLTPAEIGALNASITQMSASLYRRAKSGELPVTKGNWDNMRNYSGTAIKEADGKHGILLEPDARFDINTSPVEDLEYAFRKISFPTKGSQAFADLAGHPRLMPMLETLMGPKPILYGDQALCKPARIGSAKPWHQDSAYFSYEPFDAGVDVWVALDDAAVENGCMYVIPGGHRVGPKRHVHRDDCTIMEDRYDFGQGVPVELRAGGVLLFSVMLPHYTPPNRSAHRRRAVQLFYRAAHTRLVSTEEHARSFVETDGTPATCHATGA
jgi:phytanoyl-CoA hydroxylase